MDMAFAVICDKYDDGEITDSVVLDRFWEFEAARAFMREQAVSAAVDQDLSVEEETRFWDVPLVDSSGKVKIRYYIDEQEQR